jgi:hypothetical protein
MFTPESLQLLCHTIDWSHGERRLDALGASLLAAGVLEDVQSRAVDHLYPGLKARLFIPTGEGADEGADTVVWFEYDVDQMAEIISNYADDLPEVAVEGTPNSSPLKTLGASYSYSTEDLRRVVFARSNGRQASLNKNKAIEADKAIERKIDQIAVKGDSASGLPGLCRNANVTLLSAAAPGTGSATEWDGADKTPQEIFDDVVNLITSVYTVSNGIHEANFFACPVAQWNVLKTTQFLTSTSSPMTILEALQRQHPEVRFEPWPALQEGATGDADLAIAMEVDADAMNIELVIPMEARAQPPQPRNLTFVVPVEAKTGGVLVKRPLAMCYMDSI